MAQTPLHVSTGYNRAEIVQFLLDWQGLEKIELEAKNMVAHDHGLIVVLFSMEKLRCTWQQGMGAVMLHGCF
uniref:Uncharacterized protein n=1 Tax=Fagus sylvatica TaxID=28930 RepID=A0A2N9GU79_FAGSY